MSNVTKPNALANLKARRQQAAGLTGSDEQGMSPSATPLTASPSPAKPPSQEAKSSTGSAAGGSAAAVRVPAPPPRPGPGPGPTGGRPEEPGPLPTREVEAFAWVCGTCQRECVPVRSESRCLCGHRLREHDPASSQAPSRCKAAKCGCRGFFFVVAEGAWVLRCRCKHKHVEHDPASPSRTCARAGCSCRAFDSPWVCNCDHPWGEHKQLVQRKQVVSVRDMLGGLALAEVGGAGPAREVNDYDALKRGEFGAQ